MHMLQSILLATDFLPASHEVAQATVRLANKAGSPGGDQGRTVLIARWRPRRQG